MSSSRIQDVSELAGARVAVVGLGRTGRAVVEVLTTLGARVSVLDAAEAAVDSLRDGLGAQAFARLESVTTGSDSIMAREVADGGYRLVVVSPGVPATGAVLRAVQASGVPAWSEVELAWHLQAASARPDVPWLAVTGTDGKTTTVGMLASILTAAGLRAPAVGNIGVSMVQTVAQGQADVLAVELSSFQLHTTSSMSPLAAACLNLAPDHLDWHGSFEAYGADKARIYSHTAHAAVYNVADPSTRRMVEEADVLEGCRAVGFSLAVPSLGQVGVVDEILVDRAFYGARHREGLELATFADLAHLAPGGQVSRLPAHLVADAVAAAALAMAHPAVAADPSAVAKGLGAFRQGAHRNVTVAQGKGVTWVDDSKATNPHAAQAALVGLPVGTAVWIAGGDAKGADFHELVRSVRSRLRGVVLLGRDQDAMVRALSDEAPGLPVTRVPHGSSREVMNAAVSAAAAMAGPGDTVVLAPACASWDQFASYAERGELFAERAEAVSRSAD